MRSEERREAILTYMKQQTGPVSASTLAKRFNVSRQIIVGDVALLRAAGEDIAATPRGYVLEREQEKGVIRKIACKHTEMQMEQELNICVDYGCAVLDVIVEHPLYGQITGPLEIRSRYDVTQFIQKIREEQAHALSEITDGIHLHTLSCPGEEAFLLVKKELAEAGILVRE